MLLILFLLLPGCARLSPGNIDDIAAKRVNVVLIRGYRDWYSTGIDQLARQLRDGGFKAEAYREEQWGELGKRVSPPVVLIGFSYGADDIILIARHLAEKRSTVELLITIDPVTPAKVPANVGRCVNFYEPNGFWDIFPWLRGVPLEGEAGVTVENINVRTELKLNQPNTSHGTIAANPGVHREILKFISPGMAVSAVH